MDSVMWSVSIERNCMNALNVIMYRRMYSYLPFEIGSHKEFLILMSVIDVRHTRGIITFSEVQTKVYLELECKDDRNRNDINLCYTF